MCIQQSRFLYSKVDPFWEKNPLKMFDPIILMFWEIVFLYLNRPIFFHDSTRYKFWIKIKIGKTKFRCYYYFTNKTQFVAFKKKIWKHLLNSEFSVTLICSIDDLIWVATHHLVDLGLFTFQFSDEVLLDTFAGINQILLKMYFIQNLSTFMYLVTL